MKKNKLDVYSAASFPELCMYKSSRLLLKALVQPLLTLSFLLSFGMATATHAGIIDEAITYCESLRVHRDIHRPLPESFKERLRRTKQKALGQCSYFQTDAPALERCRAAVTRIIPYETTADIPPLDLSAWNGIHLRLVIIFTEFYAGKEDRKESARLWQESQISADGLFCPIAVFDGISKASMGKAFAHLVFPLGVSLEKHTIFDDLDLGEGGSHPDVYWAHDLSHAQYYYNKPGFQTRYLLPGESKATYFYRLKDTHTLFLSIFGQKPWSYRNLTGEEISCTDEEVINGHFELTHELFYHDLSTFCSDRTAQVRLANHFTQCACAAWNGTIRQRRRIRTLQGIDAEREKAAKKAIRATREMNELEAAEEAVASINKRFRLALENPSTSDEEFEALQEEFGRLEKVRDEKQKTLDDRRAALDAEDRAPRSELRAW